MQTFRSSTDDQASTTKPASCAFVAPGCRWRKRSLASASAFSGANWFTVRITCCANVFRSVASAASQVAYGPCSSAMALAIVVLPNPAGATMETRRNSD